jgi:penicillin-binding protein 1B
VSVEIDPQSGMPATPYCPHTREEVYIAGTQPVGTCPLHGGGRQNVTNVAGWETPAPAAKPQPGEDGSHIGSGGEAQTAPPVVAQRAPASRPETQQTAQAQTPEQPPQKQKKGFFHRLWGVFK